MITSNGSCPNSTRKSLIKKLFLGLFLILLLRGVTLEIPNLTDPTEGRYALGALDMVRGGNYLVPQILRGDIREPYLGKPPLFFWATSGAISLFGTEEWSVRLPSFLCFLLVSLSVLLFGLIISDWILGLHFALVWSSSLLPFFLFGTVSFDPLLTFFVSVLMLVAYHLLRTDPLDSTRGARLSSPKWAISWRIFFWVVSGCGVLVKGPVIILYVAAPIFLYCVLSRTFKAAFSKLGIFYGPLISAVIFVPWFFYAEQSNPGFVKYFLFSENFKRFLVKDYGDRYGTGHEYPYGFSLLFLFIGAFPWTLAALGALRSISLNKIKNIKDRFRSEDSLRFAICWAFTAPVVLIFAKQLHPGYILPALPGFSVFIVLFFGPERIVSLLRTLNRFIFPFLSILAIYAYANNLLGLGELFDIIFLAVIIIASILIQFTRFSSFTAAETALNVVILFSLVLVGSLQFTNQSSSTQAILGCIVKNLPQNEPLKIALVEVKQYAAYYYADSWPTEMGRPVDVDYVDLDDLPKALPANIIVKASKLKDLKLDSNYLPRAQMGPLLWLTNDLRFQGKISCN